MSFWSRPLSDRRRREGPPWLLLGVVVCTLVPTLVELQSHFAEKEVVEPTTEAATRAAEAVTAYPTPSTKPLPVWPPPRPDKPNDPASNGMIGAPPQRVEWPADLPKADAGTH